MCVQALVHARRGLDLARMLKRTGFDLAMSLFTLAMLLDQMGRIAEVVPLLEEHVRLTEGMELPEDEREERIMVELVAREKLKEAKEKMAQQMDIE
jgi:hypothetical protein